MHTFFYYYYSQPGSILMEGGNYDCYYHKWQFQLMMGFNKADGVLNILMYFAVRPGVGEKAYGFP